MPYFPENLATYTTGSALAPTRQIVFGNDSNQYVFPLTFQEVDRNLKLALMKQRVPFGWGDHAPPNTNVNGRDINIVGSVGSLIYGSANNQLIDYNDLENERALLAGLQVLGRQKLWTRWDRFQYAYLAEFDFKFLQDGGMYRYADWNLKFFADDPRYYSKLPSTVTQSGITTTTAQSQSVTHNGNVKAYPTFTFTINGGVGSNIETGPVVGMTVGTSSLQVRFSRLTMQGGDTLVIVCDPRPEHRIISAVYMNSSAQSLNALQYVNGASDLSNTLDFTEFFPYIPNGSGGCTLYYAMSSGSPNYNMSISWSDTWL